MPAAEDVQHDDAHDAGAEVARGGYGQAEALASHKAHGLVAAADIVGLAGALAVAHGQQQTRRLEQARHYGIGQAHGDNESGHALDQICTHYQRSGTQAYPPSALRHFAAGSAQGHGDKSQSYAVVNQHLQQLRIQLHQADILEYQQDKAAQHRHRHHALSHKGQLAAEKLRNQNHSGYQAQLYYYVPQRDIG